MSAPASVDGTVVVVLDFRSAYERPADRARLREAVAARLRREGAGEPEHLRFLVVDTPAGLTEHASAYELVMGYPTLGSVRVMCLAVGDLPRGPEPRRLRLVSVLRSTSVGVLWAADPQAGGETGDATGGDAGAAREGALGVLLDLLRTPELFDRVFAGLRHCPSSTAAPAVRALEHDLSAAARDRAWDEALARFAGDAAAEAPEFRTRDLPGRLAELAGGGPRPAVDRFHVPGGPADTAHRACEQALRDVGQARSELGRPEGLRSGRPVAERPARAVEEAARALRHYRDLVAGALRDSGALGTTPGDAGLRLSDAGITVPSVGRGGPRPTEEDLGRYTLRMLDEGLGLYAVAGRLTVLSERIVPLPAAGRLPELDRVCPPSLTGSVTTGHLFRFASSRPGSLALVATLSFLASLWPWPAVLLVLLPLALLSGGHLLAFRARPNRAAGGRALLAGPAQTAAAASGVASGWVLGAVVTVPPWAALAGLLLAVLGTLVLLPVRWARAVDDWWAGSRADRLAVGLEGVDGLLADAISQQWWAAAERTHCADAARALAGALRAAVSTPEEPDNHWDADGWDDEDGDGWPAGPGRPESVDAFGPAPRPAQPAEGPAPYTGQSVPAWLDPGVGDGGPGLQRILVADLADATVDALRRHWGLAEPQARPSPASGHPATPEQAVRRAVEAAHRHLSRNGVVPVPPFARQDRWRGDPVSLLGVGPQRLREALAPELAGRRLQPLCSQDQLALVSRDPDAARLIRFAPEAIRSLLEGDSLTDGTDGTVWTASGRFVGALRLTPLRLGTVETVWPLADEGTDDGVEGPAW
ncbi:hypothetical protein ABZ442_15445 [Streptomyces triculaminicus]|uniref:hypothetical protein n=1 Tax=Streptomyces triculaminicus TaxID=2816232 RepID=UPI0033CDD266